MGRAERAQIAHDTTQKSHLFPRGAQLSVRDEFTPFDHNAQLSKFRRYRICSLSQPEVAQQIHWELVTDNLPLVRFFAKRLGIPNDQIDEAISEGVEVLHRAVDLYDPEQGTAFSSYISMGILNRLMYFSEQRSSGFSRSRDAGLNHRRVRNAAGTLFQELGTTQIPLEEIRRITGLSEQEIRFSTPPKTVPLDTPVHRDGKGVETLWRDQISDPNTITIEDRVTGNAENSEVFQALWQLPMLAQQIVRLRSGIDSGSVHTWKSIAQKTGYGLELIQAIYRDAVTIMQHILTDESGVSVQKAEITSDDIPHLGLTPFEWYIWTISEAEGDGKTTKELAEHIGIAKKDLAHTLGKINLRLEQGRITEQKSTTKDRV